MMKLCELIQPLKIRETSGAMDVEVTGVTDDSRQVREGSLFVAVSGSRVDGHAYVAQAWDRGARAVVVETPVSETMSLGAGIPASARPQRTIIRVPDTRKALGLLAAQWHGNPSQELMMIGVTGTNGKTTVTHVIKALAERAGRKPGLLGTVGYFLDDQSFAAPFTTPGAVELQSLLAKMVQRQMDTAILEVSSHALALDRVAGCAFDIVVFTNLTQDHLDFHGQMEAYFQAKRRLFTDYVRSSSRWEAMPRAIINRNDAWGRRLLKDCRIPVWTYGIESPEAEIEAREIQLDLDGTRFVLRTPQGTVAIHSRLIGEYNVSNLLASVGVGLALGLDMAQIQDALHSVQNVPGRFERVEAGQDFAIVVDYAHTEDALARLLAAVKALQPNRIITVFGCGGDRDPGKRPKMGAVAVKNSDLVVVTSDNPRTEDPRKIIHEIERGITVIPPHQRAPYVVIPDRAQAIQEAVKTARPNDVVVIAGKGHEDYQILGTQRIDFDDRSVARQAVQAVGAGRS